MAVTATLLALGTELAQTRDSSVGRLFFMDEPRDGHDERAERRGDSAVGGDGGPWEDQVAGETGQPQSWIALPVGRADGGPTIAELVEAVKAAGGMVGGDSLFDPRYESEMRRFLIRALEMEGLPVPGGGDRP